MSDIRGSVEIDLESKKYSTGLSAMETATNSSTTKMNAMLASTVKSVDGLARSTQKAGASIHGIGNASNQLADVAVQLQGGAKFATVFAQQGSQIAAAFGPQGAILGGAIAVGAAIYTWATNAEKANKEFKESESRLKAMQAATKDLMQGAKDDTQAGTLASVKDDSARAMMRLRMEHEKAIKKIQDQAAVSGDKAAARIATEAENERYNAERAATEREWTIKIAEKQAAKERELESIRQEGRDADKKRNEMNMTAADKLRQIELELASARNAAKKGAIKTSQDIEDQVKNETKIKRLQLDKAEAIKAVAEEQAKFAGMQEKEETRTEAFEKKKQDKFKEMQDKHIADTERREGIIEKRDLMQKDLDRLKAADALDQDIEVGERINARADQIRQTPAERSAARAAMRKEARSQARAISEEIDKEDRRRRKNGGSGLTQEEKDDMRNARRAGLVADKNKNVLKASIEKEAIEELARKIAEETDKLLAK